MHKVPAAEKKPCSAGGKDKQTVLIEIMKLPHVGARKEMEVIVCYR